MPSYIQGFLALQYCSAIYLFFLIFLGLGLTLGIYIMQARCMWVRVAVVSCRKRCCMRRGTTTWEQPETAVPVVRTTREALILRCSIDRLCRGVGTENKGGTAPRTSTMRYFFSRPDKHPLAHGVMWAMGIPRPTHGLACSCYFFDENSFHGAYKDALQSNCVVQ